MVIVYTLKDKDIFSQPEFKDQENYEDRQTVKVIITNDVGDIAFVTNPIHGFFLLPGGGAESDDLQQEAIRESLEETGYHVEIVGEVEQIEEYRNRNGKHYITTCFAASCIGMSSEDLRTEEEKRVGMEVVYMSADEAKSIAAEQLKKVREGKVDFYNTAFNIVRDEYFLQKFLLR